MTSSTVPKPLTGLPDYVGDGIYLHVRGERFIDCASGTFNVSLGYSAPEIIEALHGQLDRIVHLSSEFTRSRSAEIFELMRPDLPAHIGAFWFRDITGSGANEAAIRIAQKATGRSDIFSLFLSHHGQTVATTGVSGNAFRNRSFSLPMAHSVKIPGPDCANCFYGQTPGSCAMMCARRLEDFVEYASSGRVAAVVVEPIMGNGGNIVPPRDYYRVLRETCDRLGILIIADEVQTGFGRTGSFFASTGYAADLRPDVITFAKGAGGVGIPVAGVLMRPELDVLEQWEHSSTSGANPLALVALEETVKYIRSHHVLDTVAVSGDRLLRGLHTLARTFPEMTGVRGVGLMQAFDLPTSVDVEEFIALGRRHGLILRGSRYGFGNTVKVRPPLIITTAQVDDLLSRLRDTLHDYQKEATRP
ncbi:aspartate aminotransferase family protein [Actinoplanes derwentensis]|uniref:4-aminobutyrate aminotransferase n=1 Tax=Actinoplanes derwentensis TaxID=113562 RepID=A0A1H2BVV9_9ACTN|nr:aspartate aminotransferase family protein [Actinoplanes derwentensis]GID83116.1 aspartate aminotransferase family protein [Actinoplanes derwentensis]SDT62059.1 4-aminobutyrate aminotransferase [Actinoplanes derwentensis]